MEEGGGAHGAGGRLVNADGVEPSAFGDEQDVAGTEPVRVLASAEVRADRAAPADPSIGVNVLHLHGQHFAIGHFLDRTATDSDAELAAVSALSSGMRSNQLAVIFPEGTRASAKKRARALVKIAERDPERAERLSRLQHLLPVRPAGSAALLQGAPEADIVIGWHVGFEGLDTFGGVLRHLARSPRPIRFCARRIARGDVPTGEGFTRWLDDEWLQTDRAVDELLKVDAS